ncbi:MAG TPA: HD domain-containing protein [Desulfobacterales bacterium]|nr:HD domain-containing protein [Desulfobacterales bacterium]
MTNPDLERLRSWFAAYASGFYTGDPEHDRVFRLKENHTARVAMVIRRIGRSLGLGPEELRVAETAALLHDVGRFRQYAAYRTFRDKTSENHARIGLRLINRNRLLTGFSPAQRAHIARAVAFHNTAHPPALKDSESRLFLELLRDADKLDILNIVIGHYIGRARQPRAFNGLALTHGDKCSPQVLTALRESRFVQLEEVRTINDVKLLYISWVFDLNFPASFREMRKGCYIERLSASMPATADVIECVRMALEHLHRQAGCAV